MTVTITDKRGQGTRKSGAENGDEDALRAQAEQQAPPWFPVFVAFEQERLAQLDKWGDQRGQRIDGTGNSYDRAAAGEFQRQNDARHNAGKPGIWRKILLEEVYEALAEPVGPKLFHELQQSGAVITAWMEDLIFRGVVELGSA